MPLWPTGLPQAPSKDGLSEQAPNTVIRTPMEAGPTKVRRRFTAGIRPFTMTFLLTKAQVELLDGFYWTTLVGGSLTFDWVHPRTGLSATFAFVEPPVYTARGPDAWDAVVKVEIRP